MSDERKDLPPVSAPNFLEKVRETLSVYLGNRGDPLNRGLILRDLAEVSMIDVSKTYLMGGRGRPVAGPGGAVGGADAYEIDLTPPPTPSGFAATTSKTSIQVVTAPQTYLQGHGHAKTMVYGAKYTGGVLPTFADAVKLDEFSGDVHAFPVDPASDYRLWVKWVTVDGVASAPAGGTNGVTATAGLLDDANIAYLTASKIRAGSISVGEYIQSAGYVPGTAGWRINGDGLAEFSNVVVRGTVYATAGTFSGTVSSSIVNSSTINGGTINGGTINSATLNSAAINSGLVNIQGDGAAGWGYVRSTGKWIYDGTDGWVFARLGSSGQTFCEMKAGTGRIWMNSSGDAGITFPGITMTLGGLTISQVNVIDTLNLAGDAVNIPRFAESASGTYGVSGAWVSVLTAPAISTGGAPVSLDITTPNGVAARILRNGSVIYTTEAITTYDSGWDGNPTATAVPLATGRVPQVYFDAFPGGGSLTYSMEIMSSWLFGSTTPIGYRSIRIIGMKR